MIISGTKMQRQKKGMTRVQFILFLHTAGTCFTFKMQPSSRAEGGKDLIQAQTFNPSYGTKARGYQFDSCVFSSLYYSLHSLKESKKHLGESKESQRIFFLAWSAQLYVRITNRCVTPSAQQGIRPHRPTGETRRAQTEVFIGGRTWCHSCQCREARTNPKPMSCSWRPCITHGCRIHSFTSLHLPHTHPAPTPFWCKWSQNIIYLQMCTFRKIIHLWIS